MLALVAVIIAVVSVFAVYNSRKGIDDPADNPAALAATASPGETSQPVPDSPDSATSATTPIPEPDMGLRHLKEKFYVLELINAERARVGLTPVVLGNNPVAQLHAEASLENCFSSHWGIDGLKPYMRYSLAGGHQSNGETIPSLSYCLRPSDGYLTDATMEREIREGMDRLMESPRHRDNILDRWHRKVNIGLAWDSYNFSLVQHFEGDYVEFDRLPEIEDGVLRLSGTTKNGVIFGSDEDLSVQIYFDPPPHALTPGQVSRTYCYDQGRLVGALRPPLSGDWNYDEDGFDESHKPCPDPYDVPAETTAPLSHDEVLKYWQAAFQASLTAPVEHLRVPWITASVMRARDQFFSITANLSGLLDDHGDGVYTVLIWGNMDGEDIVISQYSIFLGIVAPENYDSTDQAGFATISAGSEHTCGMRADGSVVCWGQDRAGQSTPPSGTFISVSAGGFHSCGIRADGSVECWGDDRQGQSTPPSGPFASISAGWSHSCGVRESGFVECWGYDNLFQSTPPGGSFVSVSAGGDHSCALRSDGSVECWGLDRSGQSTPPSGPYASVSAGGNHTCALRSGGTVECWGSNTDWEGNEVGQARPPEGSFISVSSGSSHSCGVKSDGSVECWGLDRSGQSTPPSGTFISVSAGGGDTCGLKADGAVACWGRGWDGESAPPDGSFISVSVGTGHSCGIRTDGSVECWGGDPDGQSTTPDGSFISVSAGGGHSCGVRTDGSVECWGSDHEGQSTPPGGSFTSVGVGWQHSCGVTARGTVRCWGWDVMVQLTRGGSFVSVSVGGLHICGVRADGSVECWGDDREGQSTPPKSAKSAP